MSCHKCSSGNIYQNEKNIKDSSNVTIIITIQAHENKLNTCDFNIKF